MLCIIFTVLPCNRKVNEKIKVAKAQEGSQFPEYSKDRSPSAPPLDDRFSPPSPYSDDRFSSPPPYSDNVSNDRMNDYNGKQWNNNIPSTHLDNKSIAKDAKGMGKKCK